jgi:hypothetical protein
MLVYGLSKMNKGLQDEEVGVARKGHGARWLMMNSAGEIGRRPS